MSSNKREALVVTTEEGDNSATFHVAWGAIRAFDTRPTHLLTASDIGTNIAAVVSNSLISTGKGE